MEEGLFVASSSIAPGHVQLAMLVGSQIVSGPLFLISPVRLSTVSRRPAKSCPPCPPAAAAAGRGELGVAAWEVGSQAGQRTSVYSGLAHPAGARPQAPYARHHDGTKMLKSAHDFSVRLACGLATLTATA